MKALSALPWLAAKMHLCHERHLHSLVTDRLPRLCVEVFGVVFSEFLRMTHSLFEHPDNHA
eukprot:2577769-Prorocentrum_lima.AAC.1